MTKLIPRAIGAPLDRIDGPKKVTGTATYSYEYPVADVAYVFPIQSTIAKGRVVSIDASAARALPGVLTVLSHENAPRLVSLDDADLAVFQSAAVVYYGQFVAAVVAETIEVARQAAGLVVVRYEEQPHDVELRADHGGLYKPSRVNPNQETDTASGDVEAALAVTDGVVQDVRIALGGVAPVPWRAWKAEAELRGKPATEEMFRRAADAELASAQPLPGNAFKVPLARNTLVRTLLELKEEER